MTIDTAGNVYITGLFEGTAKFGNITLTTQGNIATFVAKTDSLGNVLWAKQFGGTTTTTSSGITIDAMGNVYTTGTFGGTAVFGTFTLEAKTDYDIFVAKQDSSGEVVWVSQFTGPQTNPVPFQVRTIITDTQGNIYTVGYFTGNSITFGSFTLALSTSTTGNSFMIKQDSSGNVLWAKQFEATKSVYIEKMTKDVSDNFYLTGTFSGTADFGDTSLTSLEEQKATFLTKLDSIGEVVWAKKIDITTDIGLTPIENITVDKTGNVYLTGNFTGTLQMGTVVLTSSSSESADPCVIKTNNLGESLWAKGFACSGGYSAGLGITTDDLGKVYVAGRFNGTIDFEGIIFSSVFSPYDLEDAFVLKMDDLGTIEWAGKYGAMYGDLAKSIATDSNGDVLVFGNFRLTVTFGTITLNSDGVLPDVFLLKLSPEGLATNKNQIRNWNVYPNPTDNFLTLDFPDNAEKLSIEVFNVLGQKVKVFESINISETLDLSELISGIYLLKIIHNGAIQTIKIKKQ